MKHETQATRVLRDHANTISTTSYSVLRYLRRLVDDRPYTSIHCLQTQAELEELYRLGLWPPQTCAQQRKINKRRYTTQTTDRSTSNDELRLWIPKQKQQAATSSAKQSTPGGGGEHSSAPAQRAPRRGPRFVTDWEKAKTKHDQQRRWSMRNGGDLNESGRRITTIQSTNSILRTRLQKIDRTSFTSIDVAMTTERLKRLPQSAWEDLNEQMKIHIENKRFKDVIHLFKTSTYPDIIPSVQCLNHCMESYIELGQIEAARALWEKYRVVVKADEITLSLIVRTIVDRGKVEMAERYTRSVIQDWTNSNILIILKRFLEGVVKITQNNLEILRIMDDIKSKIQIPESVVLYDVIMQAFHGIGRIDDAIYWLKKLEAADVNSRYSVSFVDIVAKARAREWDEVLEAIGKQKDVYEEDKSGKTGFVRYFYGDTHSETRMLKENHRGKRSVWYTRQMNFLLTLAARTTSDLNLLLRLVKASEMEWDIATFNILLGVMCSRWHQPEYADSFELFFKLLSEHQLTVDAITFNTLFYRLQHVGSAELAVYQRFYSALSEIEQNKVNGETKEIFLHFKIKDDKTHRMKPGQRRRSTFISQQSDVVDTSVINTRMSELMRADRIIEALDLFQEAAELKIHASIEMISMAMRGITELEHNRHSNKNIKKWNYDMMAPFDKDFVVNIAHRSGHRLTPGQVSFEEILLLSRRRNNENFKTPLDIGKRFTQISLIDYIFAIYAFYKDRNLPLSHYPFTSIIQDLYRSRDYDLVTVVTRRVMASNYVAAKPLDIVPISILFKTYQALKDVDGLEWTIDYLQKKGISSDRLFDDLVAKLDTKNEAIRHRVLVPYYHHKKKIEILATKQRNLSLKMLDGIVNKGVEGRRKKLQLEKEDTMVMRLKPNILKQGRESPRVNRVPARGDNGTSGHSFDNIDYDGGDEEFETEWDVETALAIESNTLPARAPPQIAETPWNFWTTPHIPNPHIDRTNWGTWDAHAAQTTQDTQNTMVAQTKDTIRIKDVQNNSGGSSSSSNTTKPNEETKVNVADAEWPTRPPMVVRLTPSAPKYKERIPKRAVMDRMQDC